MLGFQDSKSTNSRVNAAKNISKAFSKFGKYIKLDNQTTCHIIMTTTVESRTSSHQTVTTMSKLLHILRKTLHKHTKFRVQVDENDEATRWDFICRKPH